MCFIKQKRKMENYKKQINVNLYTDQINAIVLFLDHDGNRLPGNKLKCLGYTNLFLGKIDDA